MPSPSNRPAHAQQPYSRTEAAIDFVRSQCGIHLNLQEAAKSVGLSASRLRHRLVRDTGLTFRALVREIRLLRAVSLLGDCSLRVSEITYLCGFESVPSFSRAFKCRFGLSPSRYRADQAAKCRSIAVKFAA